MGTGQGGRHRKEGFLSLGFDRAGSGPSPVATATFTRSLFLVSLDGSPGPASRSKTLPIRDVSFSSTGPFSLLFLSFIREAISSE